MSRVEGMIARARGARRSFRLPRWFRSSVEAKAVCLGSSWFSFVGEFSKFRVLARWSGVVLEDGLRFGIVWSDGACGCNVIVRFLNVTIGHRRLLRLEREGQDVPYHTIP